MINELLIKKAAKYFGYDLSIDDKEIHLSDAKVSIDMDLVKQEVKITEDLSDQVPVLNLFTALSTVADLSMTVAHTGSEIVMAMDSADLNTNKVIPLSQIDRRQYCWLPRELAEELYGIRHVIPYCCVMNPLGQILVYERQGSEKRLHGQKSIGWGGHINPDDEEYFFASNGSHVRPGISNETIKSGLAREIKEELGLDVNNGLLKFLYFYQSDKSPVDRVHSCIAATLTLIEEVDVEIATRNGKWTHLDDINPRELEDWSQVLYRELRRDLLLKQKEEE